MNKLDARPRGRGGLSGCYEIRRPTVTYLVRGPGKKYGKLVAGNFKSSDGAAYGIESGKQVAGLWSGDGVR